jgi:type II secretory pathway pseudopilin PulG
MRRQGELAFTMIEIALAIGVIGFALVAIIGILPAGLNVQKDNREDTLISQDAPYFLDAIRNGVVVSNNSSVNYEAILTNENGGNYVYPGSAFNNGSKSLDFLTNYVTSIRFVTVANGQPTLTNYFPNTNNPQWSGAEIIGLLSTPQTNWNSPYFPSNYFDTVATVRALSGPATEQNGQNSIMAFTYQMEVMITPFNNFAPATVNTSLAGDLNQSNSAYYRSLEANPYTNFPVSTAPYLQSFIAAPGGLVYNLFEVRLRFSWPVLPNGSVGPGHQTYRTLIASPLLQARIYNVPESVVGYFFQPQQFANAGPPGL